MEDSAAERILAAWGEMEAALREALPACTLAPLTQPSELLTALRISHRIGPDEEERIRRLRALRNRAAHAPETVSEEEADRFQAEAREALRRLRGARPGGAGAHEEHGTVPDRC